MSSDINLDDLREELDGFAQPKAKAERSPREERIMAGFEEIQRFVEKQGRAPQHGEDRDIFERLYAVRLDRLRALEECRSLLAPFDHQGLLSNARDAVASTGVIDDDELVAELSGAVGNSSITELRHVRASAEKRAAEEIAQRKPCADFDNFKPLFEEAESGLKTGLWHTKPFSKDASIQVGDFFIVNGQTSYVASILGGTRTKDGRDNPRLRVIFSNGTEGDLLLRSLSRSLYPDGDQPVGRRLLKKEADPLFSGSQEGSDEQSGTIYVLSSKSDNPLIAAHRDVLHKIGVTGGKVETRIANASLDPTFLLADVEIIATYELYNINRVKLENLIHRVFESAQLDIEINDRFNNPVKPREWYLVPLFVINEAVDRIKDGTITQYVYDPKAARLVKR